MEAGTPEWPRYVDGCVRWDVEVGGQVGVDLESGILKAMQEGHGGWNPRMAELCRWLCVCVGGGGVGVDLESEILKAMQEGHGGWNPRMAEVCRCFCVCVGGRGQSQGGSEIG